MSHMTIDDLRRILVDCAGRSERAESGVDISDENFDDLGYDSLALIETAAYITQEYGVRVPDEVVADLRTPREMVDLVNSRLVAAA